VIVFSTTVVTALFGAYDYHAIKTTSLNLLEQSSTVITEGVGKNIAIPLYNLDKPVSRDIIDNAMANQSVYAIVLMDETGKNLVYGLVRDPAWQPIELNDVEQLTVSDELQKAVEVKHDSDLVGHLSVYFTKKFLNKELRQYLYKIGIEIFLLIAILTFINIALLQKVLIRPIKTLQVFAENIKGGNLDSQIGHATFIGELVSLRTSLKEMAAELLYSLVKQIHTAGIQVKSSATEIFASARELEGTISKQLTSTKEVDGTSSEIAFRARQLAKTMNEVRKVSQQTADLAGEGQESLQVMETMMHNLLDASGAISAKLSIIDKKAENISTIVITINKIADQTNLLSLNAAVEAEKAGEYGRGFSVVAREIRRLSDQTEVAIFRIEKMVGEMQSAVSSGVMEMDKFVMRVNHSAAEMKEVSKRLVKIIDQVRELLPRYEEVNQSMQAQSTGAEQISYAMGQLSEVAEQTKESLHEFNRAASHLTDAVEALQAEVSRFNVPS